MNILMIDIDTLRPDHLGCYGYPRNTSPNIDAIAREGIRFEDYYCSDAPCLPSRAALMTGRFGFHSGVVGHGGTPSFMRQDDPNRGMQDRCGFWNLPAVLRRAGYYTASIGSFTERHSAWWFHAGFRETIDPTAKRGLERAEQICPTVLEWLDRNNSSDSWFLHVHLWDPHTPYRTPMEEGNPFEGDELPQSSWMNEEVLKEQWENEVGQHSPREVNGYRNEFNPDMPRQLGEIKDMKDFRKNMDGYDNGILYADKHIGMIIDKLKALGIYEDTAIIVTSDHGESLGEGGAYDEHGMADHIVTHIPLIMKWPSCIKNAVSKGFHYNIDLLPTIIDLLGGVTVPKVREDIVGKPQPALYDGESFANKVRDGSDGGREYLVVSQCCHICQRGVRFGEWMYIRTYHDGYHLLPEEELYHVGNDPGKLHNVAEDYQEVCWHGAYYLEKWMAVQMQKQVYQSQTDPLWTVIAEGGPFHCKNHLEEYCLRLEETGRQWAADALRAKHPMEL